MAQQTTEHEAVETIVHDGWAEVVLNRPERKNAINGPLGLALAARFTELDARDDVRVILLRGAEGAFCSGLDLKSFNEAPPPAWLEDFQQIWRGAHRSLFNARKPIVGALERYAINGGAALAIACDLLIVGEHAFLQVGEAQIGMAAPYNLAWLSLRHSEAAMAELVLTGDRQAGSRLVELGFAQQCVADDQVLNTSRALCERLATFPPGGLAQIKKGMRARVRMSADDWFDQFTQATSSASAPKPKSMTTSS
ncbi:MAG: enoyl-CoA hydratase/isomerase family protein [bacterium]